MTDRETYLGTVAALAEFIAANRTFPLPTDRSADEKTHVPDPRYVLEDLSTLAGRMDRSAEYPFWKLSSLVLAMFLQKAPELRDTVAPVSMTGLNISRDAPFDPLTYAGLSDVLHFINNGLLDDCWLASYEKDGEKRVVNETVDDAIRGGEPSEGLKWRGRLDKGDDWLRAAVRTYLDHRSFESVFRDELDGLKACVPTQAELMDLWMGRPYEDFTYPPSP